MPLRPDSDHEIRGWILDVYPCSEGMVLWIIAEDGRRIRLVDAFHPVFYFDGPVSELRKAFFLLSRERAPIRADQVERVEFFSGRSVPVVRVRVADPTRFAGVVQRIVRVSDRLRFYNCDISLPQLYFFERDLFPLAFCGMIRAGVDRVRSIRALDSRWDLDYRVPLLSALHLKLEGEPVNPNHGWRGRLEVRDGREEHVLEGDDPVDLVRLLNGHLLRADPDLVFTDWGDSFIVPQLRRVAGKAGVPLAFNRDAAAEIRGRRPRSYASYGRMVHTAGAQALAGRLHIDRQNSFILDEAGLEGLFEQARVCRIPVQHMARTSTGTGITSMQLDLAYRKGILIPWRKREPEAFKTALDLLTVDKGGLVFLPPVGFFEEVAELDFASMYPAIMEKFNISPETVGCRCCPGNRVPEAGYSICTRRRGLVPETLAPLLSKRARYKARLRRAAGREERERYDRRQNALKWLLIVSFGYMGYKNARFGRIEAHECVTAYSREKLLRAKEIAEGQGYRVLHAIVDSIWVKRPGLDESQCLRLAGAISKGTGLSISLEGIYRWIGFLPSRTRPSLSVPNRFLGVFQSDKLKVRGLEVRRSDTPPFVKSAQAAMIEVLRRAENAAGYEDRIPEALALLANYRRRLAEGRVPLCELVITRSLSQDPKSYRKAALSAVVAQELLARGVRLDPGEAIQYIITNAKDKEVSGRARAYATFTADYAYDREKYAELLLKAAESLFSLFGYDLDRLAALTRPDR